MSSDGVLSVFLLVCNQKTRQLSVCWHGDHSGHGSFPLIGEKEALRTSQACGLWSACSRSVLDPKGPALLRENEDDGSIGDYVYILSDSEFLLCLEGSPVFQTRRTQRPNTSQFFSVFKNNSITQGGSR